MLKELSKWGLFYIIFAVVSVMFLVKYVYDSAMKAQMEKYSISENYSQAEFECLAKTIFYEAGNQPREGKEAVALVVMNRAESNKFSKDICDIVQEKATLKNKTVCQFSYFCEKLPSPYGDQWNESLEVAQRALDGVFDKDVVKRVRDSLYFHADYVKPYWAKTKVFMVRIGNHLFYEEKVLQKRSL